MRERGNGPCLAREAGERLGACGEPFGQDLDRDLALQACVARPVDLSHPAGAELREDLVGAETGARADCHEARTGFYPRGLP